MKGKNIIWIAVSAVVAIASFMAGSVLNNGKIAPIAVQGSGDYNKGYAAGMDAAKKKLAESGFFPQDSVQNKILSGTVKSADSGKFVMTVVGRVNVNPLEEEGPAERTVITNDKTEFVTQVPLSSKEIDANVKKFQDDIKAGKNSTPPLPYEEKSVSASDLKTGDMVTVTCADDVKTSASVTAVKILIISSPIVSPGAPPVTEIPPENSSANAPPPLATPPQADTMPAPPPVVSP